MRNLLKLIGLFSLIINLTYGQCVSGDCNNGFGRYEGKSQFQINSYANGNRSDAGLTYYKDDGVIKMNYFKSGTETISITERPNGSLEFGYRILKSDGYSYLHNGLAFEDNRMFKFVSGEKTATSFDKRKTSCLIGDCENGFGAQYMVFVGEKNDTTSVLYVGNFRDQSWDGEGGEYSFSRKEYYVGTYKMDDDW
ncbi:MAG TPA: hypothetical protein DGG95_15630, partial [Cytophagales bacterium]|nr:hypothetical protein [Cytophagales bacterium]